jgi:PAS domain S-box-containing protein
MITHADGATALRTGAIMPRAEDAFWEDALAAAADWLWETDWTLRFTRITPSGAVAAPLDLMGRNIDVLCDLADESGWPDFAGILARHAPFRNLRLREANNRRPRHVMLSGRAYYDEAGTFAGYRGIGVDLAVAAERQMPAGDSENSLRAVFDHAALGIAVMRLGGCILKVNPAMLAMFGRSAEELLRLNIADVTHADDRAPDAAEARRLVQREVEGYSRENRYIRKDGTMFWGRVTASVIPGEGDKRFAVAMIEDIDDRKRAEANLSLFRKVMDASQEAVAILSPSGHILYANQAYGRLFGVAEVVHSHYRDYFPPASQSLLDGEVGPALLRGESWEGVLEACDATRRRFPVWQRAGAVRDEGGKVHFFFAFMHDHTAQQLFEDELFDAKEAAEEANVAKTRFLAAASHDLRQPMQALAMFVAVLATRNTDAAQGTLITRIQDSVAALEGLLNSLLDVSKLEAGLVEPHESDFSVGTMMKRLAAEYEPLCETEGLSLRVVPPNLTVRSDPSLLERVLRNLLNNAVRYTDSGRILLGCRRRGKVVRFEVWDTGIGIPAAELKNIFREFHQLGNSGRDRRLGLGLGLAIVERLAALLDHRIDVQSWEGKGSVFAVEVPLSVRQLAQPRPRQMQLGLARTGAAVVVIEDEPDVRESLRMLLESWGHAVVAAASADEAVRRLPSLGREPDLILADYRLQNGETGGQAIARVEVHLRTEVPAIVLTGDTAPERLRQARALGHGLLHKPVQAEALHEALDEALARGSRSRRRAERRRRDGARKTKAP